jgi:sugar lactone lactonase YvrE
VTPNAQTNVAVSFALRGFLGRAWLPVGGGIIGYAETDILVDHTNVTPIGISAGDALAVAFDADGNVWATFPDGTVRMYTPDALNSASPQAAKSVSVSSPTGIAIRGKVVAVGSCTGASTGTVFTFDRTVATPTATATSISVGCVWGVSFDTGDNGKLWVVSRSGGKVYRFTTATSGTVDPGFTTASIPDAYGIAVDGSGNGWVSSCNGNSVQQIPPTGGTPVGSPISLTEFPCPGGVALDKQGGLWVLSAGAGSGSSGSLVSITGGTPTSQLNSLTQVTFGGFAFEPAAVGLPTHQ